MHNTVKKLAAVNDLTGFGRCALTVTIPIVSAMGLQCCPVPTSVFSNHPGFPHFYSQDLTSGMQEYLKAWQTLGLTFDGILSGYLASAAQIAMVKELIHTCSSAGTKVIIDPVMGDHGKLYSVFTPAMCEQMKLLAAEADILTPNLTEACILAGFDYKEGDWSEADLKELAVRLYALGELSVDNRTSKKSRFRQIVVSGIASGNEIRNLMYNEADGFHIQAQPKVASERSGTGDVFSAILAADAVLGTPFAESVEKAGHFIREALLLTEQAGLPSTDGVYFEPLLTRLAPAGQYDFVS
ncbi:MAG: pyridoxamine kinase [Lachnospiraceae bacterium]